MEAKRASITPERKLVALRHVNRRRIPWHYLWDWTRVLVIASALFLVIHTFFIELFKIPSESMEHTLLVGDFLLVNKLAYGADLPFARRHFPRLGQPERDNIIVFRYPKSPDLHYIKRLVGEEGDTISMRNSILWRNGKRVDEPYAMHTEPDVDRADEEFSWQMRYLVPGTTDVIGTHPSRNNWGPLIVPKDSYFVLGDNRDNSSDSRYWGFVPDSLVAGRPILVYYSYEPDSLRPLAWLTHVRWHRIGERVE